MPIQLGAPPEHGFDTPLGLLSDCHRRIERFLEQLLRVVEAQTAQPGAALTAEQRVALTVALRYFREAAPMHTRDEEESLFPRLRLSASPAARAALKAVQTLEEDHAAADALHATVETLGQRWLLLGVLDEVDMARLWDLLTQLRTMYQRHIAVEDKRLFPLAGRLLTDEQQAEIGREMAARRGIPMPPTVYRRNLSEINLQKIAPQSAVSRG
jgi:hemerythrin-like domain-containing protein